MNRVNPITIEALRLQSEGDHAGLRSLAAHVRADRTHDDDTIPVHERLSDRIRASSESATSSTIPDSETETLVSRIRRQRQQERAR